MYVAPAKGDNISCSFRRSFARHVTSSLLDSAQSPKQSKSAFKLSNSGHLRQKFLRISNKNWERNNKRSVSNKRQVSFKRRGKDRLDKINAKAFAFMRGNTVYMASSLKKLRNRGRIRMMGFRCSSCWVCIPFHMRRLNGSKWIRRLNSRNSGRDRHTHLFWIVWSTSGKRTWPLNAVGGSFRWINLCCRVRNRCY